MAEIFDYIPTLTIVLVALGFAGVIVYERTRSSSADKPDS